MQSFFQKIVKNGKKQLTLKLTLRIVSMTLAYILLSVTNLYKQCTSSPGGACLYTKVFNGDLSLPALCFQEAMTSSQAVLGTGSPKRVLLKKS